jgi:hypothetical protein
MNTKTKQKKKKEKHKKSKNKKKNERKGCNAFQHAANLTMITATPQFGQEFH